MNKYWKDTVFGDWFSQMTPELWFLQAWKMCDETQEIPQLLKEKTIRTAEVVLSQWSRTAADF